jgi:HEAT repeat protein
MNFGRAAVRPLIEALDSKIWTTRFRAARLLGEIGDAQAVPSLTKILTRKGEKKDVRDVAAAALGKLQTKTPA